MNAVEGALSYQYLICFGWGNVRLFGRCLPNTIGAGACVKEEPEDGTLLGERVDSDGISCTTTVPPEIDVVVVDVAC